MKRLISILICLSLALAMLPAMGAGLSTVMCVTNCSEWVSLRESPDTSSKRLEKVRLGELVTNCKGSYDGFIECEFNGKVGYIANKYLRETEFTLYESFPGNQMVVNVEEWTSMWESPDSGSKRIVKVPVGTIVTCCVRNGGNYTYCEYKSGKKTYTGWISNSYLKKANYNASKQDTKVKPAADTEVNGISMIVVNCTDWVSLREKASASAARLAKVPLGTQVDNCVQVSDSFIYCSYKGLYGYIQSQYLADPEHNEPPATDDPTTPETDTDVETFDKLPMLPDMQTFLQTGQTVMSRTYAGYTIVVQRIANQYEEMLAVCYDLNNTPLWRLYGQSLEEVSDVRQLDAFTAGRTDDALLIWYIKGLGFYAYSFGPVLQLRWFLPDELGLEINDTIIHTEDYVDGSFYVAFSDVLMHISADGKLLWRTSCENSSIYWPTSIDIAEDSISVLYDNLFGINNMYTEVRFSLDGQLQSVTQRAIPKEA